MFLSRDSGQPQLTENKGSFKFKTPMLQVLTVVVYRYNSIFVYICLCLVQRTVALNDLDMNKSYHVSDLYDSCAVLCVGTDALFHYIVLTNSELYF